MRVAFAGCGFVADHYARTLSLPPELEVAGVFDLDPVRAWRFAEHVRESHDLRDQGALLERLILASRADGP
jgi:predicted dehydrogenase